MGHMKPTQEKTQDAMDVLTFAAERALHYAAEIGDRRVTPEERSVQALKKFHERLPENSSDPRSVVAMLDEFGSPGTVATTGGRYFGYVIGGVLPAALGASWLAGAWDQNAGLRVMSPIAAELEDVVLRWICELLGLPENSE